MNGVALYEICRGEAKQKQLHYISMRKLGKKVNKMSLRLINEVKLK